jgi:hypothetical protein
LSRQNRFQMTERSRQHAPSQIVNRKEMQGFQKLRSSRPGWPQRDWAAANIFSMITQSSFVIPVSIVRAGLLELKFCRFGTPCYLSTFVHPSTGTGKTSALARRAK